MNHASSNKQSLDLLNKETTVSKAEALALFPGEVGGKLPKAFTAVQDYHLSGPVHQTV